jgi:hypothetical protein
VAGPFSISDANGGRTLDLLSVAPPADTGQVAIPVRVISQLGAVAGGAPGGGLTDAELRASPVPVSISGGAGGGLTDIQLRASPVPVSGFPATQPVSGSIAVSNLPGIQAVSGTVGVNNFPATQPVSGSVGVNNWPASQLVSGPLTDTQLRAAAVPVSVGNFPASQPVTGTFWPATQPVSGTFWQASQPVIQRAADLAQSVTGAAAAAVTATLPAVAGQFHYISRINIIAYATVARTGAAAPVVVTSTNLPGALAWTTPTAQAVGTQYETDIQLTSPLRSSAVGTATTIVAPATASVIWRINVIYYTGP